MKFAIAAGILAQTLPVVADGSAGLLANANAKQLKLQLQDALLQDHAGQQDPDQPSLRLQAIKASRTKKRKQRFPAGELKNNPADVVFSSTPDLAFEMEYCDPASADPDVGVLSCGTGRVCEASQKSLLGGVCAERTTKKKSPGGKNKAKKEGKSHLSFKTLKDRAASFSARPSVADAKACDPKSDDPDVGVLSCDVDSFCESSPASVLGGLCVAPVGSSSRALQTVHPFCDPESDYYSPFCDCGGLDISTGTGDLVCTMPSYCLNNATFGSCGDDTCCDETCGYSVRSVNYANRSVTSGDLCFVWSTPYPQEGCLGWIEDPSSILPTECYATFDGQDCLCEVEFDNMNAYVFDCSAVGGPAGSDIDGTRPLFLMPIVESCYEYLPSCNLCNDMVEGYIPYAVGDGITCDDIRNAVWFRDSARTVFGDSPTCPAYQELAEVYCCSDGSPSGPCDLCPGSYMDPAQENASIAYPGFESNCGFASYYVEVNNVGTYECSTFQTAVSSTCCAAPGSGSTAPTDAPGPGSTAPTDAPGPGSTTPTGAPEPGADAPSESPTSDGAYGRMSKKAVVSSLFGAILSLALLFLS